MTIPASASDEIGDCLHAVLTAGVAGDLDAAMRTLDRVLVSHGPWVAYDIAGAVVAEMLGEVRPVGGMEFWSLDFPGIERASYDVRWAARFISAHANAQEDTAHALFAAAIAEGELSACLGTLLSSAAATLRQPL
ncbi:hypothetical protein [Longispora albida]|uniref:hypothetical protein n=1 Tax=Longispora albida TaxID=203523 RepID=UPI00036547D7|nr:hypothetical protein [Longispora albida]